VADKIPLLSTDRPIVEEDGSLTPQSRLFFGAIFRQALIIGTGSPEGVVIASIGASYMDKAGTTGSISYIKRNADDGAGDTSKGWILV